jgi:hypothetical protein
VQFDESEFGGPIDRDDEMELALSGSDLGDVNMEIADRVGFLRLGEASPLTCGRREIHDAANNEQRRARQMRDRRLQSAPAIVEPQQRMPPEGDHDRLLFNGQDG